MSGNRRRRPRSECPTGAYVDATVTASFPEPRCHAAGAACPNDYITCSYASESCACYGHAWMCFTCPASQPQATDTCSNFPTRVALNCRYASVTCSCKNDKVALTSQWQCGLCPAAPPVTGDACGNMAFDCRYDDGVSCACQSPSGKWRCGQATCPASPRFSQTGSTSCVAPGFYTCDYRAQDQTCICGPNPIGSATFCSCPVARPADGAACIQDSGTCTYGDATCTCSGSWRCSTSVCPASRPNPGASCSSKVASCAYGTSFCSCDGTSWSCT